MVAFRLSLAGGPPRARKAAHAPARTPAEPSSRGLGSARARGAPAPLSIDRPRAQREASMFGASLVFERSRPRRPAKAASSELSRARSRCRALGGRTLSGPPTPCMPRARPPSLASPAWRGLRACQGSASPRPRKAADVPLTRARPKPARSKFGGRLRRFGRGRIFGWALILVGTFP